MDFCLGHGLTDDGASTKTRNLERGRGGSLWVKKRNSTLDMSSGCGTCKWNSLILNGN